MKATLEQKARMRKYYLDNREQILRKMNERRKVFRQNPLWVQKHKEQNRKYRENNRQKIRELSKKYHERLKLQVLIHYGGDPPKCSCGFSDIRALTIDHINGGGRKHRSQMHIMFYQWIKKNHFPDGYQVLCMNCQFIKERK